MEVPTYVVYEHTLCLPNERPSLLRLQTVPELGAVYLYKFDILFYGNFHEYVFMWPFIEVVE